MEKMRLLNTYVNNVTLDEAVEFLLQKIRDHFGDQVIINSGYRTSTYNKQVGGATNSQRRPDAGGWAAAHLDLEAVWPTTEDESVRL